MCTVSGVVAAVLQRDSGQPRVHRLPAGSEAVDLVAAQAIAEGRSNQAICEALFLAPKTVEGHVHQILPQARPAGLTPGPPRVLAVLAFLRGT